MSVQVGGVDVREITIWDGSKHRNVIGKVMTPQGLKDFYRPPLSFKDGMDTQVGMSKYITSTVIKTSITPGTTILPVQTSAGFYVGQEVTITDGLSTEQTKIISVTAGRLTISPIKLSYKNNALVFRSSSIVFGNKLSYSTRKTFTIT